MNTTLTPEQVRAIAVAPERPARIVDPQSNQTYVLLTAEEYERLKQSSADDYNIRETYAAQFRSALKAGWDDPALDEYNNYDEAYQKLCQSREATSS